MIRRLSERFDLPLLRRELTEAARRKRLWIVRMMLAAVQGLFVLLHYSDLDAFGSPSAAASALGQGRQLADMLNVLCLVILYLLLPITACAAFANERERQTLPLLLISRISPARLVCEKFLSSFVLVFVIMLLNLPLVALAYALGGLSPMQLLQKATVLLVAAFQVNSAAIFWSAVFSTSLRAFWATLITLLGFLAGPAIICIALNGRASTSILGIEVNELFTAFWQLSESSVTFSTVLSLITPPLVCGSLFLISAVLVLRRWRWEAPLTGRIRPLRRIAEFLRGFISHLHVATRAPVATRVQVPQSHPIAWRECRTSRILQTSQYLLATACIPFVYQMLRSSGLGFSTVDTLFFLQTVFLIAGILFMLGIGSNAFGSERERETLAVLLTVPLSTRDIVLQKLAGVRRHRNLNLIPLCFLAVFAAFLRIWSKSSLSTWLLPAQFSEPRRIYPRQFAAELYTLTLAWEHLTLVMWIAACWSLASRTTLRAAIGTLSTILGYCLLHFALLFLVFETLQGTAAPLLPLLPIIAFISVQIDDAPSMEDDAMTQTCLLLSPVLLAAVILLIRSSALRYAPIWLQRDSGDDDAGRES